MKEIILKDLQMKSLKKICSDFDFKKMATLPLIYTSQNYRYLKSKR